MQNRAEGQNSYRKFQNACLCSADLPRVAHSWWRNCGGEIKDAWYSMSGSLRRGVRYLDGCNTFTWTAAAGEEACHGNNFNAAGVGTKRFYE